MKLTPRQAQAAQLIGYGKTRREAAKEVGVTPEAISIWSRTPVFRAAINQFQQEMLEATKGRMLSLTEKALETLDGLLSGGDDSHRFKAASLILGEVKPFGNDEGASQHIGSTDPLILRRRTFLGVDLPSQDCAFELCQELTLILEAYSTGRISQAEAEAQSGIKVTKKLARELLDDPPRLLSFAQESLEDFDAPDEDE